MRGTRGRLVKTRLGESRGRSKQRPYEGHGTQAESLCHAKRRRAPAPPESAKRTAALQKDNNRFLTAVRDIFQQAAYRSHAGWVRNDNPKL